MALEWKHNQRVQQLLLVEQRRQKANTRGGRRGLVTLLQHSSVCVDGLIDYRLSISSLCHLLALHANLLALQDQNTFCKKNKKKWPTDFVERLVRDWKGFKTWVCPAVMAVWGCWIIICWGWPCWPWSCRVWPPWSWIWPGCTSWICTRQRAHSAVSQQFDLRTPLFWWLMEKKKKSNLQH